MYYVCPQIELISIKPSEMYQFFIGYPPYRALPYESLFFLSFWPHGRHLLAACTQNQWRERKKETLQTHVLIRFSSGFYILNFRRERAKKTYFALSKAEKIENVGGG